MSRLLLRLAASLGLVALVLWLVDPWRVLTALGRPDGRWLAAGFGAALSATVASALRWRLLARWLDVRAPWRVFLLAYWRGITANTVLPGGTLGGDALRALHLQQAGNALAPTAISVALDRISGLWVLVVISLATTALALATGLMPAAALPLPWPTAALLALLAVLAPLVLWHLSASTRHLLPGKLARLLDAIHDRPHPLRQYLLQLAGSALVQALSILAFACGGKAVGLDLALWLYFIAAGPIFIFAALPVSVGGWGTREAAAAVTLGLFAAPRELAVASAILYGLFAALQGLLGALTLIHRAPQENHDA
ncbi:hypothetical protein B9N43_16650 [Denitratisoma sp. DHT3]|uniref:lysylphosphatidylglycerol synthase transmembrane domain-containing protein n=1 Tax=Denitratisoma sp. DHT3 TaxID=1981880 RepID=UPI0011984FA5|nr:lysylphosphatidylglycerol synthase transmembrane domain-containing protein [Denitratisoma sp. DHT3]QDX82723.1 hypothetical protein B9N43_16650 [Denitratisoma sp. DHT3]